MLQFSFQVMYDQRIDIIMMRVTYKTIQDWPMVVYQAENLFISYVKELNGSVYNATKAG